MKYLPHIVLLTIVSWISGCGTASAGGAASPEGGCQPGVMPRGHWVGEWQSFALAHPEAVRSGSIDLVIADSGALNGSTAESDNPDTGTLRGSVKASGEFKADSVVMRGEFEHKYKLQGSVSCEGGALTGAGTTEWGGSDKGNLKFRLQRAE